MQGIHLFFMAKNLGQLIYDSIYQLTSGFNVDYAKTKVIEDLVPEMSQKYPAQAEKLKTYLSNSTLNVLKNIPESIQRVNLDDNLIHPILNEKELYEIDLFLSEWKQAKKLAEYGLFPRHKISLSGPPGNGKTMLAASIAKRLDVPFLVANFHKIIESYLGKTGSNLHSLIEYASASPCVLFLDEFDSVGGSRKENKSMDSTTSEMRRITNQLLISLERLPPHTILITATNAEELIDVALKRRFDTQITVNPPTKETKRKIVESEFKTELLPNLDESKRKNLIETVLKLKELSSAWSIINKCKEARRDLALTNGENLPKMFSEIKGFKL